MWKTLKDFLEDRGNGDIYGSKDATKEAFKLGVIQSIINIFTKYPKIEKILIYGSRAKGNYKNGSDIDLTLIGKNIKIQE